VRDSGRAGTGHFRPGYSDSTSYRNPKRLRPNAPPRNSGMSREVIPLNSALTRGSSRDCFRHVIHKLEAGGEPDGNFWFMDPSSVA